MSDPQRTGTERDSIAGYERTFRRSGLPLLIEDHSASEDVFNRAFPFLAVVFIAEMVGAIDVEWPLALNILATLGGLAILLTVFGLMNRLRGRPFWSLPQQIRVPELAVFVFAPALLPMVFGGQWSQVIGVAAGNALLLLVVYLVVGWGLVASLWWGSTRILTDLAMSLTRLVRALPLLLVFALVLFVNAEMWQVFEPLPRPFAFVVVGLFAGLGLLFLSFRVPAEVASLEASVGEGGPPLRTRQRFNVGLSILVSQGLQVLVVSLGVGAFFVAFGAMAIGADVMAAWDVGPGSWQHEFTIGGYSVVIGETLLRVAGAIASFTGLYFAISISTDPMYRAEFVDAMTRQLRSVFDARRDYLALRDELASAEIASRP